jgi:ribosomal protein L37AE/L43A
VAGMTLIHIATPESFMTDAIEVDGVCSVCGHQAKIRYGWLDWHCSVCNLYINPESYMEDVLYKMRNAMGLKRKELALILGVKSKTISNSENYRCSNVIFNKTQSIFHDFIKAKQPVSVLHEPSKTD